MKKKLLSLLLLGGLTLTAGAQQLPNGDFENWKGSCGSTYQSSKSGKSGGANGLRQRPGDEPSEWNGSSINQAVYAPLVNTQTKTEILITKGTSHDGSSSVVLNNKFVGVSLGFGSIGSNAPAFITFATPWVYAVSSIKDCTGGSYGGRAFAYRPDAIRGMYKRTDGDATENAHIIAYLWKGTFKSYITSHTSNDEKEDVDRVVLGKEAGNANSNGTLIAQCDYTFSSTNGGWQEIVVPIEYISGQEGVTPEKVNVIISSAEYWSRDAVQDGSKLEVDDVQFLYYSQISSIKYNGVAIEGFDKNKYSYTVEGVCTDGCLSDWVKVGQAAVVSEPSYDIANQMAYITVTNLEGVDGDGLNTHTYSFKFVQPTITEYTNDLTVTVNGATTAPQTTTIQLVDELDGTKSFVLNNFVLGEGEDQMGIGNIKLTNVEIDANGNINTTQTILIESGDDPNIDWFGPMLGEVPVELSANINNGEMIAKIDIDMMGSLGQIIEVTLAPTVSYVDGNTLAVEAGLRNIELNRNFFAGWNTLCLPFDVNPVVFGTEEDENYQQVAIVKVQEFSSVSNSSLNFTQVSSMEANKPYLVWFPYDVEGPFYFGTTVVDNTPIAVTHGDFTFKGNYVANMPMADLYGVADKDGVQKIMKGSATAKLQGTRAYFDYSGTSSVSGMRLNLEGQDDVTSIDGVEVMNGSFDIYNLQGIRVRTAATSLEGLGRGVYVVNGKKVMVK